MKMVKNTCFVKRFSGSEEVDITELVPGDVVCLAAGDMIPADIRIIESKDLFVSQASPVSYTHLFFQISYCTCT